jgi:hypothetical protein
MKKEEKEVFIWIPKAKNKAQLLGRMCKQKMNLSIKEKLI